MTTRSDIVSHAEVFDGYHDNAGYDTANRFSADLGRPAEASCGDFVTDIYRQEKVPLPIMQPGCHTGFAYVPDGWEFAHFHGAAETSWSARPGDLACFDWNGDGTADHVEIVVRWQAGVLRTIGMNSGPSNVDHYHGRGGVHLHDWADPKGRGSKLILGVINTSKLPGVNFGGPEHVVPPKPKPPEHPRTLMLKSPMMHGHDVQALQAALNKLEQQDIEIDAVFGKATRDAVRRAQLRFEDPIGVVGEHTRHFLKL